MPTCKSFVSPASKSLPRLMSEPLVFTNRRIHRYRINTHYRALNGVRKRMQEIWHPALTLSKNAGKHLAHS